MPQNIYDTPEFFAAYSKAIDRSSGDENGQRSGPDDADPLWRRMRALLPASVAGLRVLDLGCGTGWFARWAVREGAAHVTAVDGSHRMLAKARALSGDAGIDYRLADLDDAGAVAESLGAEDDDRAAAYDVAFSCMALHYLGRADDVIGRVRARLRPGGVFVVAVEHPVHTAPRGTAARVVRADDGTGERSWNLAGYYDEGERVVEWLGVGGVVKQHRTLESYLGLFGLGRPGGFDLVGLSEASPTEEERQGGRYGEEDLMRPLFLIMGLRRRE